MVAQINVGQLGDNEQAKENANILSLIQENLSLYIVTPLNAFGLGGFVFDIEGETSNIISADITDHFLEDNTAVQDHIAIKPLRINLHSYVGELIYRVDNNTNTTLQKAVQKLTILNAYLPELAKQSQQIQSGLSVASQSFTTQGGLQQLASQALRSPNINNIVDLWALTKNLNPGASKQQQAYLYFKSLCQQKILVSIQTPFEFVTNLAIESITATQSEDTRYISDFSITLKKIQTVALKTVQFDPNKYQNRSQLQAQDVTQQGNNQGADVPLVSPLLDIKNNLGTLFQ